MDEGKPEHLRPEEMRRVPPSVLVHFKHIVLSDLEEDNDPIFHKLYTDYLLGTTLVGYTRISLSSIKRGYWKKQIDGNASFLQSNLEPNIVSRFCEMIGAGERPVLFVYRNPLNNDLLCPDDQYPYEAYRTLGIQIVPVAFIDCQEDLEEGVIFVKTLTSDIRHETILSHYKSPVSSITAPSYFAIQSDSSLFQIAREAIALIDKVLSRLQDFHIYTTVVVHYHHTLASVLQRLKSTVSSIDMLLSVCHYQQSIVLLRAIYELMLVTYLDWLAPQIIGPQIQYSSIFVKNDWYSIKEKRYLELQTLGCSTSFIKSIKRSDNILYNLLTKVSEKAKINPLHAIHKDVYKYLSDFAHQDFTVSARYAHVLEFDLPEVDEKQVQDNIKSLLGIFVTQILICINSDIGQ